MRTYKGVGTKVSPEVKRDIKRICEAMGMTQYELMQMVCCVIVRLMDDMHNLSPEMEQIVAIFERMDGWHNAYNLADPTVKREVNEAVYVHHDPDGRKHGARASLVRRTHEGWEQTNNVRHIFDRMLAVLLPEVHRRMTAACKDADCKDLVQLQLQMLAQYEQDEAAEEYRRMFQDIRTDNGKALAYGRRTKKVKRVTPDEVDKKGGR